MPVPRSNKPTESTRPPDGEETPSEPQAPTVRLAMAGTGKDLGGKDHGVGKLHSRLKAMGKPPDSPTVRLAVTDDGMPSKRSRYPVALNPPTVRLAHVPGAQGDNSLKGQRGVEQLPRDSWPALLVSYFYLDGFLSQQDKYAYRDWVMDSGAFSAEASGNPIDLDAYMECCIELMSKDSSLSEIYALDVIPPDNANTKQREECALKGIANTERMWENGIPAIPCFHYGEPWDILLHLAKTYPKIALGGMVGQKVGPRDKWIGQCFARVWPKPIHGFGLAGEKTVLAFPFHSVDATNWEIGPCLAGDSYVSTPTGLKRIDTLVGHDITVNTVDQTQVPECKAVHSGVKPTLLLWLRTDQTIRCTHNHKILTDKGWVEAGRLEIGNKVRIVDKQLRAPVLKEALFEEMLGWWVGDGHFSSGNGRPTVGIAFSFDDKEAEERLMPVWDEFVGKDYTLKQQGKMRGKTSESGEVLQKFKDIGFRLGLAHEKSVPEFLMRAESHRQLAFLRGLFSADGTVGKSMGGRYDNIQLASNSPQVMHNVQVMLFDYGIQSRVYWGSPGGRDNPQGQLYIAGSFAERYMEIVGFNISAKTNKFEGKNKYSRVPAQYSPVMAIEEQPEEDVYDLLMPKLHHFVANGIVVHNCKFGSWRGFGNSRAKLSVRGSKQNLRIEVDYYLDLERRARERWKREMERLGDYANGSPTIRLVVGTGRSVDSDHIRQSFGKPTGEK